MSRERHPPAGDSARTGGALVHRCTLPVLGIPVRFEANDRRPIEIAEEAFGAWRTLESNPGLIDHTPLLVRVLVGPGREGGGAHAPLVHRPAGPGRVTITSPGSRAVADVGRREATIRVTEELLGDRQHFRYGVLESVTLCMLSSRDRQPVHAAAITRANAVLVLAGPSGTGKSTLAYAAATRLGCRILAEDVVNVQMRPALRLWGLPGFLHLPPHAARHFPELARNAPTLSANGKTRIAVALERIGALPHSPFATRAGICILERGDGPASLEPLEPAAVVAALTTKLEPGFDVYADTVGDCLAAMAAAGGWRLRTTARPADAYPLLDRALAAIAGS
jgi:hypothetical protein